MRIVVPFIIVAILLTYASALDAALCLQKLRSSELYDTFGVEGKDINGVDLIGAEARKLAVSISYHDCRDHCPGGDRQEPFKWHTFARQFSQWLLPWLALLSQLPYGAETRPENIMSMILTVGSPTLAGYSLILTALNNYYVASRFSQFRFPNVTEAKIVLIGLQQVPLRITHEKGALASLVVLPQNDEWWLKMNRLMTAEHTWTISACANLSWVLAAYLLTVIESLSDIGDEIFANGEAAGAIWLWLLAIVIGWLVVAPKCDSIRLQSALSKANQKYAYVATHDRTIVEQAGDCPALWSEAGGSTSLYEEISSPPIFNYSRLFSWNICVNQVAEAFRAASYRAHKRQPVDSSPHNIWLDYVDSRCHINLDNRRGTQQQVIDYCTPPVEAGVWGTRTRWGPAVVSRMVAASVLALMVQWSTAGAAIIVVLYCPRTGLGCRSGAYLLYAIGSTIIWALMVLSGALSHYSITPCTGYSFNQTIPLATRTLGHFSILPVTTVRHRTFSQRLAGSFAVALNATGKALAMVNSVWIMCACIFQFSNVFNTCFCNASVFGNGEDSFVVLGLETMPEITEDSIRRAWIGAVGMALVSVALFLGFIWMYRKPPAPVA